LIEMLAIADNLEEIQLIVVVREGQSVWTGELLEPDVTGSQLIEREDVLLVAELALVMCAVRLTVEDAVGADAATGGSEPCNVGPIRD
jgi:hypothetical protein